MDEIVIQVLLWTLCVIAITVLVCGIVSDIAEDQDLTPPPRRML